MGNGVNALFEQLDKARETYSSPKTMKDLKAVLKHDGNQIRNDRNNKIKRISPRKVADIMEHYLNYGLIVENELEMEKARVSFYDLDAGIYRSSRRSLVQLALSVERNLTVRQQNEVVNYLYMDSPRLTETKDPNLVVVGNGIFNRKEHKLIPFSPKYIFTSKVATNYNSKAIEPSFNGWNLTHWIKQLSAGDKNKERLLWQVFASVINPNLTKEVAIFLVDNGQGRTGKSTFEQLLENLVGTGNYGSLKLKEFEQDFKLASATGKSLIVGDDNNPNDYNKTSENFKSVATGENVLLNPKGMTPFNYRFNAFIVQSMNGMPRFKDNTSALFRRFRIIKFNHQYPASPASKKIKDEYIKDKQLLEFILKKALSLNFDVLQDTKESQRAINEVKLDNDSVDYFIQNYLGDLDSERIPVKFLFYYFLASMESENNPQSIKQNTFTKRAKPLMKNKGWEYSRNNLAPLELWNKADLEKLKSLDVHYKFSIDINPYKKQPLFEKQQKKHKKL